MPGPSPSFANHIEFWIASSLLRLLAALPLRVAYPTAIAAARLLDLLVPKLRRVARRNLSFAYPDLSASAHTAIINGVFCSIGRILLAMARFPSLNQTNVHQWISYRGLENYQTAKSKGKGILVATAHFGNWELSAFAHALMTEPMNVMVRPLDNPLVDNLVEHRRTLSGNRLIEKKDAVRSVLRALRSNETVGILCDQNTTPAEGVFIDFFGRKACATSAFVKLAHHSGAAVILGYAVWDHATRHYTLVFEPELHMSGDIATDTQAVHHALEAAIRRHPDQWLWIHRRWKTRPFGEPPLY